MLKLYQIDLNCDLGEIDGDDGLAQDTAILPYISSANVACGFHAGNEARLRQLARLCSAHGIAFGAHPGYPDRQQFGRVVIPMTSHQITDMVAEQIETAAGIAGAEGICLTHVKPHGALYNLAAADADTAEAVAAAVKRRSPGARLVGPGGSRLIAAGVASGLRTTAECFADRNYRADGSLVPRDRPGSVLHDVREIADRAVRMIRTGRVTAIEGTELQIVAGTICVHGDTRNSVEIVIHIREVLDRNQIQVCRPGGMKE